MKGSELEVNEGLQIGRPGLVDDKYRYNADKDLGPERTINKSI
jgi:hypothetical protein